MITRRNIMAAAATAAPLLSGLARRAHAQSSAPDWDHGQLAHLLPTVSSDRMLIKASFRQPLTAAPFLQVGETRFAGVRGDSVGLFWQFHAADLRPGTPYQLTLRDADGNTLAEPWTLKTFPAPGQAVPRMRLLMYSCAGGHDVFAEAHTGFEFLPTAVRQRLLKRALSFQPDALVANGDHVYWDLLAPRLAPKLGANPAGEHYAGRFDRAAPLLGSPNEQVLLRAAGPQIVPVYGTLCRSVPVFFLQDDHDHFDNDEATDEAVTFPPDNFMIQAARATQRLYYPEFLPDPTRPAGLPGEDIVDRAGWRPSGLSESFGTLRYGNLAEVLLYDVRRTMTLNGPTAVFVAPEVEAWVKLRMAARDTAHVVNAPSNPPGWSAGKWGEWYPDILGADGKLTVATPKPYWQPGWLAQHDRLLAAMAAMPDSVPLVITGDLHATAEGRILASGNADFSRRPVIAALPGAFGTSTGGWASEFRGVGPSVPNHLRMEETVRPVEENGFSILDFTPEAITIRYFKWNQRTQAVEAIDTLEPFHTSEWKRG
jgi:hypothetical protein